MNKLGSRTPMHRYPLGRGVEVMGKSNRTCSLHLLLWSVYVAFLHMNNDKLREPVNIARQGITAHKLSSGGFVCGSTP